MKIFYKKDFYGVLEEKNKLKNQVKVLTGQIKEKDILLSKRYILKKLSPGRTPNMNKTKISKPMSNTVRNYMKREFDNV